MPICSYLVIPREGAASGIAAGLGELPGCDVVAAREGDVLLLVTETESPAADRALRTRIEQLEGVRGLVLTFGEIDPERDERDPE